MKGTIVYIVLLISFFSFAQEKEKAQQSALKKSNDYVHEGNQLISKDNFVSAEMEYRKAISTQPTNMTGAYNLGNSYYKKGNYEEALYREQEAAKNAVTKEEKHKAYHNIGNILMQNKQCREAVEAYKSALRNDPADDETRYNLAMAKECAKHQKKQNKDNKDKNNKDKKDQDKKNDQQNQKDKQDQKDKKDQGDQNKDQNDKKKDDNGKPKDNQEKKDKQKQPRPQQLSPQQIKNLLEAMNNQEQKVQKKMNAKKETGIPIKTDKDW